MEISNVQAKIVQLFKTNRLDKKAYLKEIVRLFNSEMNREFDFKNLSIEQEKKIQRWLYQSKVYTLESINETYLKRNWFRNEFDKKDYLLQFHCKVCEIDGLTHFPIRISPMSRQVKSKIKNKFQKLIKSAPYVKNKSSHFTESDRLCLKLIFVINESRDKDVDNMAKITLDGLKGILFPDDKQIDHLEVIKFKTKYLEDHISISIGRSHFNENKNILFRGLNMGWAGLEKMK